ncbi:hypothetical protein Psi02_52620 [Planotetraspora silvatica]|uniref:Uncharacterized protein n=1 Tax=Planotetraspora silvatica TaxID=234614 RepID=A0A8J3UMU4_9ACTN|nr:hypothetical protein Psi02_52620 [Planotetraspora silvatica]
MPEPYLIDGREPAPSAKELTQTASRGPDNRKLQVKATQSVEPGWLLAAEPAPVDRTAAASPARPNMAPVVQS